ncbi:MAG: sugar transferase [Mogibacterium sp.]|nr:sugar transferase [Mogibacterium sp.]
MTTNSDIHVAKRYERRKAADNLIKHFDFIVLDMLALQISFVLAYLISRGTTAGVYSGYYQRFLLLLMVFCQLMTIVFSNNYEIILRRGPYEEAAKILRFTTMMGVMLLMILFIFQETERVSRLQTGWTMVVYVITDWIFRFINKRRIRSLHTKGEGQILSMIVMAAGDRVDGLIKRLSRYNSLAGHKISGIVITDENDAAVKGEYGVPLMHIGSQTIEHIQKGWVDEIFFFQSDGEFMDNDMLNSFIDMGIAVHICPERLNDADMPLTEINTLGDYTVLTSRLRFFPLDQLILKRLMDIIGGIVGCVMTGLLTIVIGPIIYIKSPGPVFFAQNRIGRNGRVFKMYKFRSMYMDAEARRAALMEQNKIADGMMFKMDDDPRIIGSEKKDSQGRPRGIGNFIRKTSIDEFPQFWNVLKGDMSIVGTRPPLPDEWEKYDMHHRARMTVKPGITGLWQISGRSDITDFDEVVRLDMEYIGKWTVKEDIKIIIKTIGVVFSESGAS